MRSRTSHLSCSQNNALSSPTSALTSAHFCSSDEPATTSSMAALLAATDFSNDNPPPTDHNGHERLFDSFCNNTFSSARNKRKNFRPRNILQSESVQDTGNESDTPKSTPNGKCEASVHRSEDGLEEEEDRRGARESASDKWSQRTELLRSCFSGNVPSIKRAFLKTNTQIVGREEEGTPAKRPSPELHAADAQQQLPLDLSQSDCRSSPPAIVSTAKVTIESLASLGMMPAKAGTDALRPEESETSRTSLGFWRPTLVSGIAPWIDPSFLSETGMISSFCLFSCFWSEYIYF